MAGGDLGGSPGEAGLLQPPSEPQAAGAVPQEAAAAAQRHGRSSARGVRVSESVQTRALELLHVRGAAGVWTRADERWVWFIRYVLYFESTSGLSGLLQ